jgi:pilus assembly protein Flp/PilA
MLQPINQKILRFVKDESGPTAVEYAVMLALIITLCITAIAAVGGANGGSWGKTSTEIDSAFNGN